MDFRGKQEARYLDRAGYPLGVVVPDGTDPEFLARWARHVHRTNDVGRDTPKFSRKQVYTDGYVVYGNLIRYSRHWVCDIGSGDISIAEDCNNYLHMRITAWDIAKVGITCIKQRTVREDPEDKIRVTVRKFANGGASPRITFRQKGKAFRRHLAG